MENAERRRILHARDPEEVRAKPANDDALVDDKLSTGQRDVLTFERAIEIDGVAVLRIN